MRTIEWTRQFRRDYRRVKATPRYRDIDALLESAAGLLARDEPLPRSNRDHALTGEWAGFRECHLRPDLLLIYDKPERGRLVMVRMGSHSELFR
jgi:mRNA interferase YafQ